MRTEASSPRQHQPSDGQTDGRADRIHDDIVESAVAVGHERLVSSSLKP